jgi:hypothetical protein
MSWHGQKRIESAPRWPDERPAVCDDRWQGPLSRADEVTRTIRGDARFDRKADAVAWEQDQTRRLRLSEWVDPRRGHVPLSTVATSWLAPRSTVKRRTQESDEAAWGNHIGPRFGNWPVGSITTAEVSSWVGGLVTKGLAPRHGDASVSGAAISPQPRSRRRPGDDERRGICEGFERWPNPQQWSRADRPAAASTG